MLNEKSEPELMCLAAPEEREAAYRKGVTHGIEAAIQALRAARNMPEKDHLSLSSARCFLDTLKDFASDMEEREDHAASSGGEATGCTAAATPYPLFIDILLERFDAWLETLRREQERIKAQLQLPALTTSSCGATEEHKNIGTQDRDSILRAPEGAVKPGERQVA